MELVCNNGGYVEIIAGTDARSAEALEGNKFVVTHEDEYRYFGTLVPKYGFMYNTGLSGHRFEPKYIGKPVGIEYAVMKSNLTPEKNDFWATWEIL